MKDSFNVGDVVYYRNLGERTLTQASVTEVHDQQGLLELSDGKLLRNENIIFNSASSGPLKAVRV